MKEFKGTQGKWHQEHRLCDDGNYRTQVFCEKGIEISTLAWYPTQTKNGVTKTYREPNAKLIVAAPELLLALQQLVHLHSCEQEGLSEGQPTPEQWLNAVSQAQSVITKALGE